MQSARLEVRLDEEQRRRLGELAQTRGVPVSEAVRSIIDEAYEVILRERRMQAVRELAAMEIEDVPDPEELSRQLNETYAPTGLS